MTNDIICTEIYEAALALIGERSTDENDDYRERAPYLLAAFCGEAGGIDSIYRRAKYYGTQPDFGAVMIELNSVFPLSERFVSPAAHYVAAMLMLDENEELSDKLYEKYCDKMSVICSEVGIREKITDVYEF